jgi:hypothetical protein
MLCTGLAAIGVAAQAQTPSFNWSDQYPLGLSQNAVLKGSGASASLTLAPQSHLSGWTAASNLPAGVSNAALLRSGNSLYLLGGQRSGAVVADVLIATIGADGKVSAFVPAKEPLPVPLGLEGAAVYSGVIYLAGGDTPALGAVSDKVWMSVLGADGQPGPWKETTALPEARDWLNLIADKGRLYAIAGAPAGDLTGTATVWSSSIRPDGTLGDWQVQTANIPKRYGAGGFALGDRIWLAGGTDFVSPNENILADVKTTALGADGTPSDWADLPPLPQGQGYTNNASVVSGGRVYLVGGQNGSNVPTPAVPTAPFQTGAILGDWSSAPALPLPLFRMAATANESELIAAGGADSDLNDHPEVFVGALAPDDPAQPAAFGVFESPIIDLGQEGPVGSLGWTVADPTHGAVSIQYRVAPKTGDFGPWSDSTDQNPVQISDSGQFFQYRLLLTPTDVNAPEVMQITRTTSTLYGDLNGDKLLNVLDGVLALRMTANLVKPTDAQLAAGDVAPKPGSGGKPFGDGRINVLDAVRILRAAVKLDHLP